MLRLTEATQADIDLIERFLAAMAKETKEFAYDSVTVKEAATRSFDEGVHWFLFYEDEMPFGVCYIQSVHNYWRLKKRFYLGGFYIAPDFRGQGRFRVLNDHLWDWVVQHGGTQIYAHIHKDNAKSIRAFTSQAFEEVDYRLYVRHQDL